MRLHRDKVVRKCLCVWSFPLSCFLALDSGLSLRKITGRPLTGWHNGRRPGLDDDARADLTTKDLELVPRSVRCPLLPMAVTPFR